VVALMAALLLTAVVLVAALVLVAAVALMLMFLTWVFLHLITAKNLLQWNERSHVDTMYLSCVSVLKKNAIKL
jgi:uncharacterized SAM-binding protein YcdF (DUF218 family)